MSEATTKCPKRLPIAIAVLVCVTNLSAQTRVPKPRPTPRLYPHFANHVPKSAEFFLTIRKPMETDSALRRANAWPFLTLLAGRDAAASQTARLSDVVTAFLGPESTITADDLMQNELSFVTSSWSELGGAIWLLRPPDEAILDRWFPQQSRPPGGQVSPIRSLRAADGLRGVLSHEVLVLGRRTGKKSLWRHCALLIAERRKDSLFREPNYQKLWSYMPGQALATAYLAGSERESIRTSPVLPLPALQQAVIGLYERQGVFDVAIHGIRPQPVKTTPLSHDTFSRFVRLPQPTMLAVATTIRSERWQVIARAAVDRFLPELLADEEETPTVASPFDQLGSQFVVAVERDDFETDASTQVAFLIRCTQTQTMISGVDRIVRRVLQLVARLDPVDESASLEIERESHLGVPIHFLRTRAYVEASRFSSLALFRGVDPAWAIWGDWLILASDREYVKRIVDAQFGLTPTLAVLPDVQQMNFYRAKRSTIAIVQPGLATAAMTSWLKDYDTGLPSLLDPRWWDSPDADETFLLDELGIVLGERFEPGEVSVGQVLPDTPVAGAIEQDDRILGLDGVLLDLDFPEASLRRMFLRRASKTPAAIRLLRRDTMMDVAVTYRPNLTDRSATTPLPAEALRNLLAVLKTLDIAKFTVYTTGGRAYSAKLSLRFARPG